MKYFLFFTFYFLLSVISFFLFAQSIGNGKDGSPNISGIINYCTPAISDIYKCQKKISVKNTSGFAKGDLILIIQMQGVIIDNSNSSDYGKITDYVNSGNYEYGKIDYLENEHTIFLSKPLIRNFSALGKTQIVRVPQYENSVITGTLTCKKWDGETGGVLAFDATDTLFFNAHINVNGKGFRGGITMKGEHFFSYSHDYIGESYNPDLFALKGEGIAFDGIFPFTSGRGAPANGGGGGNIHTAGGGGGSNYGWGGKGGWGYPVDTLKNEFDSQGLGGYSLLYSNSENKISMGGGGGAGHEHFNNGTDGGCGGGIVIITANSISGNSKFIMANGNNSASSGAFGDGTGGAGAGGTILISAENFLDTILVSAKGGDGGSSIMKGFGPGGGAGGGVLCLSLSVLQTKIIILSLNGGIAGLAGGNFYGAENGGAGGILYNFKIPFNNLYNGVTADFSFSPSYLSSENNSVSFINKSTGASNYQWNFGDEIIETTINPLHIYSVLNNYDIQLVAMDSICSDTARVKIHSEFIPNIFTPNGDGKNDFFFISIPDSIDDSELEIFNRWGEIVFEKKSKEKNEKIFWNGRSIGKELPESVYYFTFSYSALSGEKKILKGFFTLAR